METTTEATNTETHKILATGIKRELACRIDDRELLEIAIIKSDLEVELKAVEDEFGEVKREWSKRIDEAKKRIEKLGGEIHTRERKQVVICHERIEIATRMVETVREDTEQVCDRRVANLFEAGKVLPQPKHVAGDEVPAPGDDQADAALADAAEESARDASATQRSVGVAENDEGDVVPIDEAAKKRGKGKRK